MKRDVIESLILNAFLLVIAAGILALLLLGCSGSPRYVVVPAPTATPCVASTASATVVVGGSPVDVQLPTEPICVPSARSAP